MIVRDREQQVGVGVGRSRRPFVLDAGRIDVEDEGRVDSLVWNPKTEGEGEGAEEERSWGFGSRERKEEVRKGEDGTDGGDVDV